MRIACPNPDCKKTLKVKNDLAGKKIKCPGCGQIIKVPRLRSEADVRRSVLKAELAEKIRFKCTCGRSLAVASNLAGRKALCPGCGNIVPVPDRAEADTEIEATPPPEPAPPVEESKPEAPILPDEIAPEIVVESDAHSEEQRSQGEPQPIQPVTEERETQSEDEEASTYGLSLDDQKDDTPPTGSHDIGVVGPASAAEADADTEEDVPVLSDEAEEVPVLAPETATDEGVHILSAEMEDGEEDYVIPAEQLDSPPPTTACPYCGEAIEERAAICTSCGTNILTGERLAAPTPEAGARFPAAAPTGTPSLWHAFGESFIYPFRGTGLYMVLLFPIFNAFGYMAVRVSCIGILIYGGIRFGLIFQMMRCAAAGPKVEPEWPDFADFWETMARPFVKLTVATLIFAVAPIVAAGFAFQALDALPLDYFIGGAYLNPGQGPSEAVAQEGPKPFDQTGGEGVTFDHGSADVDWETSEEEAISPLVIIKGLFVSIPFLVVVLAVWFCYPMTFTIVGIYDSLLGGINPVVIFRSIFRIPLDYVLIWLFLNALIVAEIFANLAITLGLAVIPYGSTIGQFVVLPLLSIYLWFVIASCLGFMAYRNKARLGW